MSQTGERRRESDQHRLGWEGDRQTEESKSHDGIEDRPREKERLRNWTKSRAQIKR